MHAEKQKSPFQQFGCKMRGLDLGSSSEVFHRHMKSPSLDIIGTEEMSYHGISLTLLFFWDFQKA